ncbi:hypothetical protein J6590_008193 [Homalodisca vitripennis]|nr:hypothetical protein J6590_008193 [Homalodisca vitripennis]
MPAFVLSFFVAEYFWIPSDKHDSRFRESSLQRHQTSDAAQAKAGEMTNSNCACWHGATKRQMLCGAVQMRLAQEGEDKSSRHIIFPAIRCSHALFCQRILGCTVFYCSV